MVRREKQSPGSLKNALDWLVSSGELMGKPVVLLGGGPWARASLTETLTMLSATVLGQEAPVPGPVRTQIGPDGGVSDPAVAAGLRAVWAEVVEHLATAAASA